MQRRVQLATIADSYRICFVWRSDLMRVVTMPHSCSHAFATAIPGGPKGCCLQQEGRLAVLDALSAVVAKFPQEALDEHADSLALPLVLRLVNDPAPA